MKDKSMKKAEHRFSLLCWRQNSSVGYTHFLASRSSGAFNVTGCFSRNAEVNEDTGLSFGVEPEQMLPSAQAMFHAEDLDAICAHPNA